MHKVKRSIRRIELKYLAFLSIGCLLFFVSDIQNSQLSREQFLLQMLTEHYYITYFMIPLFLIMLLKQMEKEQIVVVIRYDSYWRYFKQRVLEQAVFVGIFMSVQLSVMVAMTLILPANNTFISKQLMTDMRYEVLNEYARHFDSPLLAIFIGCIYMGIGLLVIAVTIVWIEHFFETKAASKIVITMYLFIVIGLKFPFMSNLPFLCMDNYVVFHRNFYYQGKLVTNLISIMILGFLIYRSVKYAWHCKPSFQIKSKIGITQYYSKLLFSKRNVMSIIGIGILLSSWLSLQLTGETMIVSEYFQGLFAGIVPGNRNIILTIFSLVITFTPIYIIMQFLEREGSNQGIVSTIRLNKTCIWYHAIRKSVMKFLLLYVLLITSIGLIVMVIVGGEWKGFADIREIMAFSTVKYLDLVFQFFFLFALYCYFRHVTIAFCIGISFNLISLLPLRGILLNPVGLFDIGRIGQLYQNGWIYAVTAVIGTSVILILLHVWILKKGHQRLLIQ